MERILEAKVLKGGQHTSTREGKNLDHSLFFLERKIEGKMTGGGLFT